MRGRRRVAAFLVVAFGVSWVAWGLAWLREPGDPTRELLTVAGRFGPSLAAILVVVAATGRDGLPDLLRPLRRWRAPARLWVVTLAGPVAVTLAAIWLAGALGAPVGSFNDPAEAYLVVPAFVAILVLGGPLGEELGWRGYLLDPLQDRFGPLAASILIGGLWGAWHLPLFFDPDAAQHALPVALYLGQTTSTSVVYTWLWNRTRSLPVVLCLHTMTNLAAGVFPLLPPDAPGSLAFGLAVALAVGLALLLVVGTGGRLGRDAGVSSSVRR